MISIPKWYNPRKVAQIVAYFAGREGDPISVLKLVKLIYLADRRHMEDYAHPLFHDDVFSMPHGPVHSVTYDFIDGKIERSEWSEFLKEREGDTIKATRAFDREDLDELSAAEMDTLKRTWEEFGRMNHWEIRDWTHENCPEWENPDGSSKSIPHERIFGFLGYSDAEELGKEVEQERRINEFWASR